MLHCSSGQTFVVNTYQRRRRALYADPTCVKVVYHRKRVILIHRVPQRHVSNGRAVELEPSILVSLIRRGRLNDEQWRSGKVYDTSRSLETY